jgi:hypothetical protein
LPEPMQSPRSTSTRTSGSLTRPPSGIG